jgi:hypothetical protein
MRLVQGLAIGALVAFELTVLGMIAMPRVEPDYHAFFIERSSDCWPYQVSTKPGALFLSPAADEKSSTSRLGDQRGDAGGEIGVSERLC